MMSLSAIEERLLRRGHLWRSGALCGATRQDSGSLAVRILWQFIPPCGSRERWRAHLSACIIWHRGLARRHDVTVVGPPGEGLEQYDAVIAQRLPGSAAQQLAGASTRVVYDLYTPTLPETLASLATHDVPSRARLLLGEVEVLAERLALATGDAFICASERQRDYWIGALGALGRLNLETYQRDRTFRNVIDVVPFGVPEGRPERDRAVLRGVVPGIEEHDKVLLWAGGIVDWTDPLTVIRAVARLAESRSDLRLVFLGATPPGADPPRTALAARAEAAGSASRTAQCSFSTPGCHTTIEARTTPSPISPSPRITTVSKRGSLSAPACLTTSGRGFRQ